MFIRIKRRETKKRGEKLSVTLYESYWDGATSRHSFIRQLGSIFLDDLAEPSSVLELLGDVQAELSLLVELEPDRHLGPRELDELLEEAASKLGIEWVLAQPTQMRH